jgi:O-antigen/teichoic acid export membrane protein
MSKLFEFKFLKEVGVLGISNLLNAASNGLIIIQLNKYLNPNQSGVFLYLLAIASPIFIFFGFDLRRKITINQLDGLDLKEVFSLRNSLSILGFFFFALVGFIFTKYDLVFLMALATIGIGKLFDTATESNHAIYQYYNYENKIFVSRVLKIVLSCLAFLLGANNNFYTIFALYVVLNALPVLFIDLKIIKKLVPEINFLGLKVNYERAKDFLKINLGLALGSLIMVLTQNVPTYFIKYYLDYSSVTYFSSVNYILQAVYVGGGAGLGYAMLKKFRNSESENLKEHLPILGKTSLMSLVTYTFFGAIFYAFNGLTLLFGAHYATVYGLFFILLYSGYFFTVSSFLNNFLLYCNKKSLVLKLRIIRIVVIIGLCILFPFCSLTLNSFGYALLATNCIDCVLHASLIHKLVHKNSN